MVKTRFAAGSEYGKSTSIRFQNFLHPPQAMVYGNVMTITVPFCAAPSRYVSAYDYQRGTAFGVEMKAELKYVKRGKRAT